MKSNTHHLLNCCVFLALEKQRAAEQIRQLEDYRLLTTTQDRRHR